MRILADQNIPAVKRAFSLADFIKCTKGEQIGKADLNEIDTLLVRSVTRVDQHLLDGSNVTFVGSATAGVDHIDQAHLRKENIGFAHAPGANATSVAEYVSAALLQISVEEGYSLQGMKVGVVGCGEVGSRVCKVAQILGMEPLPCDPPLEDRRADPPRSIERWYSLEEVLQESDVVSLHVPLTSDGKHPTNHLMGDSALTRAKPGCWLINTSRGGVVDSKALLKALEAGEIAGAVLDVWEDEPTISKPLAKAVFLATPHIAGYSLDGKLAGTHMIYRAAMKWHGRTPTWTPANVLGNKQTTLRASENGRFEAQLHHLIQQMYDIVRDDRALRQTLKQSLSRRAEAFIELRATYWQRREFAAYTLPEEGVSDEVRRAFYALQDLPSKG